MDPSGQFLIELYQPLADEQGVNHGPGKDALNLAQEYAESVEQDLDFIWSYRDEV